jgi:hypothetical protein
MSGNVADFYYVFTIFRMDIGTVLMVLYFGFSVNFVYIVHLRGSFIFIAYAIELAFRVV